MFVIFEIKTESETNMCLRNLRGRHFNWFLVVKSLSAVKLEGFGFKN